MATTETWQRFIGEIEAHVATHGVDRFYTCPAMQIALMLELNQVTSFELQNLGERETRVAYSLPESVKQHTIGGLVHSLYHLSRFGRPLDEYSEIVEIGGGFGAMAYAVRALGYGRPYKIVDFPIMHEIQQWFLKKTLGKINVEFFSLDDLEVSPGALLLSTWGLSEIPLEDRERVINNPFAGVLIASQSHFEAYDNKSYFTSTPFFKNAVIEPIEHLPGNFYVFGPAYHEPKEDPKPQVAEAVKHSTADTKKPRKTK